MKKLKRHRYKNNFCEKKCKIRIKKFLSSILSVTVISSGLSLLTSHSAMAMEELEHEPENFLNQSFDNLNINKSRKQIFPNNPFMFVKNNGIEKHIQSHVGKLFSNNYNGSSNLFGDYASENYLKSLIKAGYNAQEIYEKLGLGFNHRNCKTALENIEKRINYVMAHRESYDNYSDYIKCHLNKITDVNHNVAEAFFENPEVENYVEKMIDSEKSAETIYTELGFPIIYQNKDTIISNIKKKIKYKKELYHSNDAPLTIAGKILQSLVDNSLVNYFNPFKWKWYNEKGDFEWSNALKLGGEAFTLYEVFFGKILPKVWHYAVPVAKATPGVVSTSSSWLPNVVDYAVNDACISAMFFDGKAGFKDMLWKIIYRTSGNAIAQMFFNSHSTLKDLPVGVKKFTTAIIPNLMIDDNLNISRGILNAGLSALDINNPAIALGTGLSLRIAGDGWRKLYATKDQPDVPELKLAKNFIENIWDLAKDKLRREPAPMEALKIFNETKGKYLDPIVGQEKAKQQIISTIQAIYDEKRECQLKNKKYDRANAIMLSGPPGVGKTAMVTCFAKALTPNCNEESIVRITPAMVKAVRDKDGKPIPMAEAIFNSKIGKKYDKSKENDKLELANDSWLNKYTDNTIGGKISRGEIKVLFLDEYEKTPGMDEELRNIIDDGEVSISGRTIDCSGLTIFVVGNMTHSSFDKLESWKKTYTEEDVKKLHGCTHREWEASILNRFERIIMLDQLTYNDYVEIMRRRLSSMAEVYESEDRVKITGLDNVINQIATKLTIINDGARHATPIEHNFRSAIGSMRDKLCRAGNRTLEINVDYDFKDDMFTLTDKESGTVLKSYTSGGKLEYGHIAPEKDLLASSSTDNALPQEKSQSDKENSTLNDDKLADDKNAKDLKQTDDPSNSNLAAPTPVVANTEEKAPASN